jgi:dipeptide/tripeptide permease
VNEAQSQVERSKFPPLYWLVIVFEFFERGSYYGVMSVLSVYLTDVLGFPKQDVGLLKGTIQPLLYFLPIISGALADRFGYRRALFVAFSLLGGGYFLTSQATGYAPVFLSLVVMGIGAGTFKPIISGTIARCTDESNSTLGFGIFYWSINLGAFVFPLLLVPYLKKNVGWDWVLIAAAIGTGAMLLPTLLFYREPPGAKEAAGTKAAADGSPTPPRPTLLQTLANAFEIVYSPFVLLRAFAQRSRLGALLLAGLCAGLLGYGAWAFARGSEASASFSARSYALGSRELLVKIDRNLTAPKPFKLEVDDAARRVALTLHDPDRLASYAPDVVAAAAELQPGLGLDAAKLARYAEEANVRHVLWVAIDRSEPEPLLVRRGNARGLGLVVPGVEGYRAHRSELLADLRAEPTLVSVSASKLDELVSKAASRPFVVGFIGLLLCGSLVVMRLAPRFRSATPGRRAAMALGTLVAMQALFWTLHLAAGLSLFATILSGVIGATLLALYGINTDEVERFHDHFRFILMIFIYSGFWVLYFQMFDSVLWYVQAYVDASSLNRSVNAALGALGLSAGWRFDVEHVTVVNGGAIILLQLLVSTLVKKARALPTMVVGISLATVGMAMLAISTGIWVFLGGIVIFSIGEMTAHPKFISYVGQTAPKARVAMYMGYLFLYGVIGSSIGSVVGANLYVHYVDELSQPRTLWLIFASIGLGTIVGLLLYDRFVGRDRKPAAPVVEAAS